MDEKMRIEGNGEVRSQPWPRQFDNDPSKWFELIYKIPKREWVGLTDGEMQEAMEYWSDSLRSSYGGAESASEEYVDMVLTWRYIEAKLKEKNT
jgi:hypothetical protein